MPAPRARGTVVTLSGFATLIADTSDVVSPLTVPNPMRYLVVVRGLFLQGMGPDRVAPQPGPLAALAGIAAASLTAAVWLLLSRMA